MARALVVGEQADGFERHLRRISHELNRVRVARCALSGATYGALSGALLAGALWALDSATLRPWALLAVVAGACAGAALGLKKLWSERDAALFLDARLEARELVTSALDSRASKAEPARYVRASAARALADAAPARTRLRLFERFHLLIVPAALCSVWLARLPLPRTTTPAPRGAELVKRSHVSGLDRVEALAGTPSLSPADAERLKKLAEDARKLRADLARGLERRDAQARAAALRDGIAASRERFDDRSDRPGLEAALQALESEQSTQRAAKALGDGDIVAFDEEMQRLANQAETRSRDAARRALEDATRAAHDKGSERLSQMLNRERESFAKREAKAKALRELAKALKGSLPPEAARDLRDFEQSGDPRALARLSDALADALSKLDADERRALAEALKARQKEQATSGESALDEHELEALAQKLSTAKGRAELERMLKELAREPSADAERERSLDDAERGTAEAERGLGAAPLPLPLPGASSAAPSSGPEAKASGNPQANAADGSPARDGPASKHEGATAPVQGGELRARANARALPGAPLAARTLGRAPGRAGETANQVGTGNLSARGSAEVGAVEGADIPEEYREHVGRYFEP